MSDAKDQLARVRDALEAADRALVEALDRRAQAIGDFLALRDQDPGGFYRLPADDDVIGRAAELAKHFPRASIEPVMREVLSATERMVAVVSVAFLGPEGGFAPLAARRRFGSSAELRPADSVAAVLDEVQRGRVSFGVVPLETSSDGAVTATLHGLVESEVTICGELTLPASYHLLSKTGGASDIEQIYAAPGALAACERAIRSQFPRATLIDVPSGEVAAQFAREDARAGAVGTEIAAEAHGLRVVRERVEDETGIETRFAVVGTTHPGRTGRDQTVIALAVHDGPGSLYEALKPFASRDINLVRLESRPSRSQAFPYVFFVEMEGHVTDRALLTALEELRGASRFLKILGSYPRPE